MNSVSAPPLASDNNAWPIEAAEAHALTYLAAYAGDAENARATLSFKRSFGMLSINYIPASSFGGTAVIPGIVIATYADKVILAVPGATLGFTTIANVLTSEARTIFSLPGRVQTTWANIAEAIEGIIESGNLLGTSVERRSRTLVFAGFSTGACIAEILAKKWANMSPKVPVKVFKFGSPRVGNQRWQDYKPTLYVRYNSYLETDPLSSWPVFRCTSIGSTFASVPTLWSNFVKDPVAYTWDKRGAFVGGYQPNQDQAAGNVERSFFTTMSESNILWWHNRNFYRVMWANWAGYHDPVMLYRLLGLEFPDDQRFHLSWSPGAIYFDGMFALIPGNPADIEPTAHVRNRLQGPAPESRDNSVSGTAEGGEWGGGVDDPEPWGGANVERVQTRRRLPRVRRF